MDSCTLPEGLVRYGHETTVREGRAFHYQDDPCGVACFLLEGTVRPVKFGSDGKSFDLPALAAGQWFGLAEVLSSAACLFDAVAATPCRALVFTRQNLELALREPSVVRYVLEALSVEIIRTHRILAEDDATGKVVSFLLSRRFSPGMPGERTCVRLTQGAIAEAIGLTRETVNRQLRELESLDLVSTGRGEICILDWNRLAVWMADRNKR
jgi:CRP-like cAMP-binding protein